MSLLFRSCSLVLDESLHHFGLDFETVLPPLWSRFGTRFLTFCVRLNPLALTWLHFSFIRKPSATCCSLMAPISFPWRTLRVLTKGVISAVAGLVRHPSSYVRRPPSDVFPSSVRRPSSVVRRALPSVRPCNTRGNKCQPTMCLLPGIKKSKYYVF